ncbi:MAG: hypothetical protein AVDCRST_MAG68-980, partial [uncultured Gemmatimonadetes bacterium]
ERRIGQQGDGPGVRGGGSGAGRARPLLPAARRRSGHGRGGPRRPAAHRARAARGRRGLPAAGRGLRRGRAAHGWAHGVERHRPPRAPARGRHRADGRQPRHPAAGRHPLPLDRRRPPPRRPGAAAGVVRRAAPPAGRGGLAAPARAGPL